MAVLRGVVAAEDWPPKRAHNAEQAVGLETKPVLLLLGQSAAYLLDGFAVPEGAVGLEQGVTYSTPVPKDAHIDYEVTMRCAEVPPMLQRRKSQRRRSSRSLNSLGIGLGKRRPTIGAGGKPVADSLQNMMEHDTFADHEEEVFAGLWAEDFCVKIPFESINAVFKRRYQLRPAAIEIMDGVGKTFLLALPNAAAAEEVLTSILSLETPNSLMARYQQKIRVAGQDLGVQVPLQSLGRSRYKQFFQQHRRRVTKDWLNGSMSNFEYLMHLNTLAGRSFNDLTQYPVFPWVLADYDSETLDLNDPSVFRDLSKPMGALGEARAQQFRDRYEALEDFQASEEDAMGGPQPFHYGTHYSCAGYVLYYLLRIEPYSHMHLNLQGGRFDRPDRLFREIKSSWLSASSENLQDVRELIPEFYNLPEMFRNKSEFDFGVTQKGIPVDDVTLPPWAKTPEDFVRIHRQALESKQVSEHLHLWIDLIFGCKQRSKEAQNVFVGLTYENEIDLDSIEDPMLREATLAQIHNFGQTPSKLFKRPHPKKLVPDPIRLSTAAAEHHLIGGLELSAANAGMVQVDGAALAWHEALTPPLSIVGAPQHVLVDPRPISNSELLIPSSGAPVADIQRLGDKVLYVHGPRPNGVQDVLFPPSFKKFVRFGAADCGISFHVHQVTPRHRDRDRLVSLHEQLHLLPVTCVTITPDGHHIATGSYDSTIRVWAVSKQSRQRLLEHVATMTAHKSKVLCLEVCPSMGMLVSGGQDRRAVIWNFRTCSFLHELRGHTRPVSSVSINPSNGDVVTLSGQDIRLWSLNGELLAMTNTTQTPPPSLVMCTTCAEWFAHGVSLIVGHTSGEVSLWSVRVEREATGAATATAEGAAEDGASASPIVRGKTPPKSFELRQVLPHEVHMQNTITALRLTNKGQELLVGDSQGNLTRWTTLRLTDMSSEEVANLVVAE